MLSWLIWVPLVLATGGVARACPDATMPREVALAVFKDRVLGRMGLEEPPPVAPEFPSGAEGPRRRPRRSSGAYMGNKSYRDTSEIILFPSSDSPCSRAESSDGNPSHFSYYFLPSVNNRQLWVTSATFWFYAGSASNSSSPLYISTPEQGLECLAEGPSVANVDGWTSYDLDGQSRLTTMYSAPFTLQVRGKDRLCHGHDPERTPFLHLRARPRVSGRRARHAAIAIPWSPFAVDLLRRTSPEQPEHSDCWRDEVDISFDELGWGNWIVHPKVVTFRYCHGNCSAADRTATSLGIQQCCSPVPESMRSLRITSTSDGGYSFKYETLLNIIPEACSCV